MKIAQPKETYDKMQHAFFQQRLQVLNKPQKQLNMEAHLQQFDDEKVRQERSAAAQEAREKRRDAERKQEMRRIQINKLQRNAGFMEQWLQKGVEDWKVNQMRKKDREAAQLEFEFKQAEKYNSIAMEKLDDASREVHEGIEQFETTLRG